MMNNEIYNFSWKPKIKMVGKGLKVNKFPGSRAEMKMKKGKVLQDYNCW